ncbi:MAG: RnfABCDGE type electron transport complex subunit D [Fibrobacterales bacterium]
MAQKFIVSLSPHEKATPSVTSLMWGVVIALIPTLGVGLYYYGIQALAVVATSVVACLAIEHTLQRYLLKEPSKISDGSAVITGLLLAFNVPSITPLWQVVIGAIVAIGVSKIAFGGLGNNPFNPALIGRAFMLASFPVQMTTWAKPGTNQLSLFDATTGATPLGHLAEQGTEGLPTLVDMIIGNIGGCFGEISAVAVLIGGCYMLYKKIITWHIPVFYLLGLFIISGSFWLVDPVTYANPLFHIFAGGAMLGAWFMATDMVTSPMTPKGQIIFALGGGILCALIRILGAYPEGCSYSILIMNAFVPLIDKACKPKRFGKEVNVG